VRAETEEVEVQAWVRAADNVCCAIVLLQQTNCWIEGMDLAPEFQCNKFKVPLIANSYAYHQAIGTPNFACKPAKTLIPSYASPTNAARWLVDMEGAVCASAAITTLTQVFERPCKSCSMRMTVGIVIPLCGPIVHQCSVVPNTGKRPCKRFPAGIQVGLVML
tara:strand:- start:220 stop:708 length:489 start_codon:yes stop_codon:yes gene_type:complete